MSVLKFWWVKTPSPGNFGDILTPHILDYFDISWEYSKDYNAISIGSIAKHANNRTIVLGSGIMGANENVCATADWRLVRGPITRNRVITCGGVCPEAYGDPALLLPLLCDESAKEHDVGIVPHFVDYDYVKQTYPNHNVINLVSADPLQIAKDITRCRSIISSSLHGIIAAHAYGIPAAWVPFGNKLKGDGVKFQDHYATMGLECQPSTIDNPIFTTGSVDLDPIITAFESIK